MYERISFQLKPSTTLLTPDLHTNIIRRLPIELRISFKDNYTVFINLDTDNNFCCPAVFKFLNQYVENLNNSYTANPMLFDVSLSPMNVGMKQVCYEVPKKQERNSYMPAWNNQDRPRRPCPLCSIKGFEWYHYPLNWKCGVKKLSSTEIIKTVDDARVCHNCCRNHQIDFHCKPTFWDGTSRVCTKKCSHNGHPLNRFACKHNKEAPTVSVSKVWSDRSIPLVENITLGCLSLGIQYDTGCQLSHISRSVLRTLPSSIYSQGNSTRVRVLSYTGEGKVNLTTEIKLKIFGQVLKLSAIEEDLNNG